MSVKALQDYTFSSKYARYSPENKRRETWTEAVERVRDMHLRRYPQIAEEINWAFEQVKAKRVLGSQRALQFGGSPIEKKNSRMFNCIASYCDRQRFFQECFWLLLCGCVPPDTKVLTEDGPKEIKEIKKGDRVWSYNQESGEKELKKVQLTHDVHVPVEDNIEIKGRFGSFITSKKHPVLVLRDDCWVYVPASNISLGDIIQKNHFSDKNKKFCEEAYIAGFFMGDGHSDLTISNSRRIRSNGDNQSCLLKFAECLEKISNEEVKCKPSTDERYDVPVWEIEKTFSKDNNLSKKWTDIVGDLPSNKTYVTNVPDWISCSYSKNKMMSFLAGLIDSDGNVSDSKIHINTSSKKMRDDLLMLLPIYGIYPWVTEISVDSYSSTGFKPTVPHYRINFSSFEFKEFSDFIGHDNKRKSIESFVLQNKAQHKTLVVPMSRIDEEIKSLDLEKNKQHYNFRYQIEKHGACRAAYYTSREKSFSHLMQYDEVVEITDNLNISCDFKDITVEDNNSYLCGNGSYYTLHNCGTGFSVQKHHIDKLPDFIDSWLDGNPEDHVKKVYLVPDSIEGWADCLGVLLSSFLGGGDFPDYAGYWIDFDYSLIRPEGAPLRSSSGKAPGSKPLKNAIEKIREIILKCVRNGQKRFRPIDAYDIVMHASDAVLSGGVRRSATICLFSPDDKEMATAKIGNWFIDNPQRGRSNNSAILVRDETTKEQFEELMGYVREFGEPGFIWSDSTELMVNPCVTADTTIVTTEGIKLVENLLNKPFSALVDGESYQSKKGFWFTGKKKVTLLEFSSGRTLKVTPNHQLLTTHGWKKTEDIDCDEDVVIHNHRSRNCRVDMSKWSEQDLEDYSRGYCLGNFLADGNESKNSAEMKWWGEDKEYYRKDGLNLLESAGWKNNHHVESQNNNSSYASLQSVKLFEFAKNKGCLREDKKELVPDALCGSWRYLSGIISGYFDADGTVAVNHNKGCSLRFTSVSLTNLKSLQIALNAFGIYSKIYNDRYPEEFRMLPDGNGGKKEFYCQSTHELCVSCDNILEFQSMIPIRNKEKSKKISEIVDGYKRIPNRTHFVDQIVKKTDIGVHRVYDAEVDQIHAFDANSVYAHNCVEIGLYPVDVETGESGWEACNLCEINGRFCKTERDFYVAAKAAAIIGTCQAGYTDLTYLGKTSKKIIEREALLGISITGMMDNPEVLFDPKLQRKMAKLILKINDQIAEKIGINPTARATCVKPAGTTSCILGTASGIHPHHARRYIRRSQGNYLEPPLRHFKETNPIAVEKSVWSANGTDEVAAFCVEVPKGAKTKNDIDAISLLEHVKSTQQNWVMAGTVKERCAAEFLVHNVSNTISVREDEWESVSEFIYDNRQWFAGISLLPITGDKDYPQAPFTAIYTPTEIVRMYGDGSVMASGLIVDGLHAFDNNLWKACDAALGQGEPIVKPETPERQNGHISLRDNEDYKNRMLEYVTKEQWIRRAKQFAERYFNNDVRKMTYCLKDVSNWKLWCDLNREYKDVDYTLMIEEQDNTSLKQTIACAGGACDLQYA